MRAVKIGSLGALLGALLLSWPQAPVRGAAGLGGEALSVAETAQPLPPMTEEAWTPAPRPEPGAGIRGRVQCRRVCSYRVLKRRGVVISKTPTACRVECPGMSTRSCSLSDCR